MDNSNKKAQIPEDKINFIFSLYSSGKINRAIDEIKLLNNDYPNVPLLFNILGACYQSLGQLTESIQMFSNATKIKPDYVEAHFNLGVVLKESGKIENAIKSYNNAINFFPKYFDAHNNLGNALKEIGRYEESIQSYKKALEIRSNSHEVNFNLARVCQSANLLQDAVNYYQIAIALKPDYAQAHNNLGVTFRKLNQLQKALIHFERAESLMPEIQFIKGPLLGIKKALGLWDSLSEDVKQLSNEIRHNENCISPFYLMGMVDDPALQRKNNEIYLNQKYPNNQDFQEISRISKSNKIRIGYFSADFRNHAMMHLMMEFFENHDKHSFELVAFSFGSSKKDKWRNRVEQAFDIFLDVSSKSDNDILNLSKEMNIEIAVDLMGYTNNCRPEIFIKRCAPIQISFLGFPGTTAIDNMDYIVADSIVIPRDGIQHFSEKVIYMPNCYQVNMSNRFVSKISKSKSEHGLPENAFVFCCFNNTYKITQKVFNSWMKILKNVKGSILWLFENDKNAIKNLIKEAKKMGINPNSLVFAAQVDVEDHLRRIKYADLFLDTLPYNAHTTASDALRMGVPLITKIGDSFASRVAASLLNSVNMPELITHTSEDYELLAIDLATNPKKLKAVKEKLEQNLIKSTLFNAEVYTRDLELGYKEVFERYHKGIDPDHIEVKNLK